MSSFFGRHNEQQLPNTWGIFEGSPALDKEYDIPPLRVMPRFYGKPGIDVTYQTEVQGKALEFSLSLLDLARLALPRALRRYRNFELPVTLAGFDKVVADCDPADARRALEAIVRERIARMRPKKEAAFRPYEPLGQAKQDLMPWFLMLSQKVDELAAKVDSLRPSVWQPLDDMPPDATMPVPIRMPEPLSESDRQRIQFESAPGSALFEHTLHQVAKESGWTADALRADLAGELGIVPNSDVDRFREFMRKNPAEVIKAMQTGPGAEQFKQALADVAKEIGCSPEALLKNLAAEAPK